MRWVSAGHDPVLVYTPTSDSFREVGEGDLPLGVMDETVYEERVSDPFQPGEVLFIGTDGVWEMPDMKGDQYGKDRLREVIRETASRSAAEIAQSVRERLDTGSHQHAGLTVHHGFTGASMAQCHHRPPARLGFERHDAEVFFSR